MDEPQIGREKSDLGAHYSDPIQQQKAATFGMWIFLASEVLFFGGLFLAYTVYRISYPEVFKIAGSTLNLTIGTINTVILLTSSYWMALSLESAKTNQPKRTIFFLSSTWLFGFLFLILKGYEYYDDIEKHLVPSLSIHFEGPNPEIARLFYFIYYLMTGLHAMHMAIGLGIIGILIFKALRRRFSTDDYACVEVTGLYWHFVDLIWIFLYPLFYLMGRQ